MGIGPGTGDPHRRRARPACGTCTCLRFCLAASPRSTHPRARHLSRSWSLKRPVERRGAEFHIVQRRADDRPGRRRCPHRRRRLRVGIPDQRGLVCRRARLAESASRRRAASAKQSAPTRGSLAEGFRYVWKRPDLKAVLLMLFLIGTFGLNFPIFISTMSVTVFHAGAGQYGLLTSIMAIGSVAGALLAARREKPRIACCSPAPQCSGSVRAGRDHAQLLALWSRSHHHRHVRADVHHHGEQHGATIDRARHARARDGDPARHRIGRHTHRRTHCRLGSRYVRPALGAWRRRRLGFCRGDRGIYYLTKYRHLRVRIEQPPI
jgi:hypothetical protein